MAVTASAVDLWVRLSDYGMHANPQMAARVRRWLEAGADASESGMLAWLRALEDRGLGRGTVNGHLTAVRAFLRWCGQPAPKVHGWRYDEDEAAKRFLSPPTIASLVTAARESLVSTDAARWALAAVWGLRVGEIARVRVADVDLAGGRLFVRSEKGSVQRWVWLPPEVRPWLDIAWRPSADPKASAGAFSAVWEMATDAPRPKGTAWHAVRRSLTRELDRAGVSDLHIERFMRWRSRSMVARYTRPNVVVSFAGEERIPEEDMGRREADQGVWDAHPFISLWA